jgi:endonuclease-3
MKKKVSAILETLEELYPDAVCSLDNDGSPFHLLVRAILSAQCTDKRVNEVSKPLFAEFPDAEAFSLSDEETIGQRIKSCGLYRAKAHAIFMTSNILLQQFNGEIPARREQLESFPGVGRKIANLILGELYGIPAIVVDTHCSRVAVRLGLSDKASPSGIEKDLMTCVPRDKWIKLGHRLVAHGRDICSARNPRCGVCPLREVCTYAGESPKPTKRARRPVAG